MTFEEWLTEQYALHTSYSEGMQSHKQSDIKEYLKAAWEAGYEQGQYGYARYSQREHEEQLTLTGQVSTTR